MVDFSKKDISQLQKLYLEHYGKVINKQEAKVRLTALINLLGLSIEIENSLKNNPDDN